MPGIELSGLPAIAGGEPAFEEFLVFGKPSLGDEEIDAVTEVIRSAWIGTGERCIEFETRFAETVGAGHAVSVSSCTAALHAALVAIGVGPGDEVVTTPFTFVATLHAVVLAGATPVLADVDPETLNVAPDEVRKRIGPRTRAILPVHFGGLPTDMALRSIAEDSGLPLVEDAAHALGARVGGVEVGGGDALACFSFYPNKNITTGEGGMITTADAELAERLRTLRLQGLSSDAWKRFGSPRVVLGDGIMMGFKYNLTDLAAAIGLVQLERLPAFLESRRALAALYDRELEDVPGLSVQPRPWTDELRHSHHLYIVQVDEPGFGADRDLVLNALRAENIGAGLHYRSAHLHPYYEESLGLPPEALPAAAALSQRVLSLPLAPTMDEGDVIRVAAALRRLQRHVASAR